MDTIGALLGRARRAIEASDARLHDAAECIAMAKQQGATQERIAKAVGRSTGWVSGLLRWRREGYKGTAFGPQSKAQRTRAAHAFNRLKAAPTTPEKIALFEFKRARAQAVTAMFGATISNNLRDQLVAALAALPADHPAERVRKRLGMAWEFPSCRGRHVPDT
jgi:transposase-like protein